MNSSICRWGILGAAFIARKNWQAMRDAGNARLVAVASRDLSRAKQFIAECQASAPHVEVPEAMDSYDDLLARQDIDAVYIPLPTGLRKEWVLKAARAGKHVLVEKPVGRDAAEVKEIVDACAEQGVQFMDGVMFMHGDRLLDMRRVLDRDIGEIRHIASQFSFLGGEEFERTNIRANGVLEPLGCLGDLGWYCIRFALWAMNYAEPSAVSGCIHTEAAGDPQAPPVPVAFSGSLSFPGGVSASFYCSFTAANAQWAVISGAKGLLELRDFVLPFSAPSTGYDVRKSDFIINGCRFDMHGGVQTRQLAEPSNNAPGSQEANLFRHFSALVLSRKLDDQWPRMTLLTQRVLDACLISARDGGRPRPL